MIPAALAAQVSNEAPVGSELVPVVQSTSPCSFSTSHDDAGGIAGIVTDKAGAPIDGATVTLHSQGTPDQSATTSSDGRFRFDGVFVRSFTIAASQSGMTRVECSGELIGGQNLSLAPIVLVAIAQFSVDAISAHEMAELQIKQEETQRILGILPNFYVVYSGVQAPLDAREKYRLAFRSLIDPVTFGIVGITAGVQQENNTFPGYGRGASGYGKRFGANFGDVLTSTVLGTATLPALFHQDPRYFFKGKGSVTARFGYALSTAVRQKSDSGHWQIAYSSILGGLASGAISNAYYPARDRNGPALTFENAGLGILSDAINNAVEEFVFRRLTTHSRVPQ